ncbi:MAG: hypothetical protein E6J90_08875 [Deltaproteobacteria bacterium]|nr:MAG: hypothetical protein E6J90_08875 [Deltaproteobacteria bacterium]
MDLEVIRRILVEAKTTGVEQTTAQLKGLSAGYEGVTVASQKTETATESVARKFASLEARLDPASRAAQQLAKDIKTLDAAMAQGGVSAQRHGELLSLATGNALKMGQGVTQAAEAHGALEKAMESGIEKAREYAGEFGALGNLFAGFSTRALLITGALGAAYLGFEKATESANEFAASMLKIHNAAENIGITATQFQALAEKAAGFGVSEERLATGLERFSSNMEEFRKRTGGLYTMIDQLDHALAQQMVRATGALEPIKLLAQAYNTAGVNATALSRAAGFGRTGFDVGLALKDIGSTGGVEAAVHHAVDVIDNELVAEMKKVKTESDDMAERASRNFASIYAPSVLASQKRWNEQWLEFSRLARDFAMSPDLAKLIGEPAANALRTLTAPVRKAAEVGVDIGTAARPVLGAGMNLLGDTASDVLSKLNFSGPIESAKLYDDALQTTMRDWTALGEFAAAAGEKMLEAWKTADEAQAAIKRGEDIARTFDKAGESIKILTEQIKDMKAALDAGGNAQLLGPAINAAQVQLRLAQDSEAATQRHNTAVLQLADSYKGVSIETAITLERQRGQLDVASAITGAQKLIAQEVARTNELLLQGKSAEEASAIAAGERAIAQAQINAGAQNQLFALQNAAAGAAAVTGQQKIQAQYQATINQLLHQGVDLEIAMSVASQELANAQAAATAAVEQSIIGLHQQLEVLQASTQAEKDSVLARQAYDNAVKSGADPAAARELQAAMEDVSAEKRRQTEETARLNALEKDRLATLKQQNAEEEKYLQQIEAIYSGTDRLINAMDFNAPEMGSGRRETGGMLGSSPFDPGLGRGTVMYDWLAQMQNQNTDNDRLRKQIEDAARARAMGPINARIDTQINPQNEFEMRRLEAQISGNKPGEISAVQGELAYYQGQPRTLENLQQIKSLSDALKQLTDATKDNTASQNALSGLYSRQFGQGFYDGGAAVGELIYGLDNNTGSAIDAMQRAANDNTRTQNDLLTNLSQNQINSYGYYGGGMISATSGVQGELRTGFSNVSYAISHQSAAAAPSSPSSPYSTPAPSPTTPPPIIPFYPHIPGTPGFARGGSFTTAGYGGDDSNVVAFRVSPQRERVTITPMNGGGNAGGGGDVNNYNDISINIPQGTDEFRSSAMHVADEIYAQVAYAGRRK